MIAPLIALAFAVVAPVDDTVRFDVTRDTWLSGEGSERDGSNGGSPRLKLKGQQEFTLVDIADPKPEHLRRVIRSATLHVKSTGEPRLKRVTVGGLASPFHEGTGTNYETQRGSSTFRHARNPDAPWVGVGDVANILFGPRGQSWKTADATPPDKDGWQTIAVDPRVVAARFAGLSGGFVVFDDTGTEWSRDGDRFTLHPFPNRFIYGRDQNSASAPYFTVVLGARDELPPDPVTELVVDPATSDLPEGEAIVSWLTPRDHGPAGVLGFRVAGSSSPIGLDVTPLAGRAGERVRIHLTRANESITVEAVDAAGNGSSPTRLTLKGSRRSAATPFAAARPALPAAGTRALKLGGASISVIDELDKVDPVRGTLLPARGAEALLRSNHLFDATTRRVHLEAARGEAVACQIVVSGSVEGLKMALQFDGASPAEVGFGRYVNVMTKNGPMPDPIVPLTGPIDVPEAGVKSTSLHVELQVSKNAKPGSHKGKLVLSSKSGRLDLPFELTVSPFVLPDHLSFLPEMNCYGLPGNERDFYRLAHRHRTILNRVPYSHNGSVHDGFAPKLKSGKLDWTGWDKRFGPLFDGSAFADLPRKGVPLELFYLPLFENWPTPIDPNYNGDYWADRAFTPAYRAAFVGASKQIAAHIRAKGWNDTFFECFFNGKTNFKAEGWSRGTSPWLLDEPASFQDFWALRYFGGLFHEGINAAPPGKAKLVFRADISRPQWQRDLLDDVLDINVVGGAVREYLAMVMERKGRLDQVVIEYGGTNSIDESNVQPVAWCIDAWTLGLDGVLPWQTVGTDDSWKTADELSLFYPAKDGGPPIPSIRLKAYRRGQQDVEYLTLLTRARKEPRRSIAGRVRLTLKSAWSPKGSKPGGSEDAGRIGYGNLSTGDLANLRGAVRDEINALAVKGQARLVDFHTPRRDPRPMQDRVVADPPR